MIRFAGLQVRAQLLTGAACLLVIAVVAFVTGSHIAHLYRNDVVPCAANGDCNLQLQLFFSHDNFLQNAFDFTMRLVPGLIGLFWGAPLFARELETGTFRVAWTQSVSRSRWLATKLAIGGLASFVAAGLFGLMVTWWYRAFDLANGSVNSFPLFDRRDLVAAGYGLFAFAVGALLGAAIRRVLPAIAATLAVFVLARIAITAWVRPHYMAALHKSASLLSGGFGILSSGPGGSGLSFTAQGGGVGNDWVLHSQVVNQAGQPVSRAARAAFLQQHCANILPGPLGQPPAAMVGRHGIKGEGPPAAFQHCQVAASRLYHLFITYQPGSRYWPFQWIETGIFTGLALAAFAACFWVVNRRIA